MIWNYQLYKDALGDELFNKVMTKDNVQAKKDAFVATLTAPKRISNKKFIRKKVADFVVNNSIESQLFVVYNARDDRTEIEMLEDEWIVVADKMDTDCRKKLTLTEDGKLIVESCSSIMLEKTK